MWSVLLILIAGSGLSRCQAINRAPHFIQGGDMARLAVSESTPPGAPVYTLQGEDPERSRLHYSISGEYFTVDRSTGVVVLRKPLDREVQDLIEVIISITGYDLSADFTFLKQKVITILFRKLLCSLKTNVFLIMSAVYSFR